MSIRANRLADVLAGIGVIEDMVDEKANLVFGTIALVRDKVEAQYEQAVANDAVETAAEQAAKATAETVIGLIKTGVSKVTDNPNVRTFIDTVVAPIVDPGFDSDPIDFGWNDQKTEAAPETPFAQWNYTEDGPVKQEEAAVPTRQEKIEWVRNYYEKKHGVKEVWPNPDNVSDEFVDGTYDFLQERG